MPTPLPSAVVLALATTVFTTTAFTTTVLTTTVFTTTVLTTTAFTTDANACSPEIPPVYVFDATLPAEGQRDVHLNSGFQIFAVEAPSDGPRTAPGGFTLHELVVTPLGATVPIEGRLVP